MGKIFDFMATGGDWKDYRQVRAMKAGEELMKTLKQQSVSPPAVVHSAPPVQQQNISPAKIQINKCSKCKKGILVVNFSSRMKMGFKKKTVTTFISFCPVCGNTIKKEVEL